MQSLVTKQVGPIGKPACILQHANRQKLKKNWYLIAIRRNTSSGSVCRLAIMDMLLSCYLLSTLWLQQIRQMRLQHITSAASIRAVRVFLYTCKWSIMVSRCLFRGDAHEGNDSRENLLCTYSPHNIMFNRSKPVVHV